MVIPHESDLRPVPPGGGARKIFATVDAEYRKKLISQLADVQKKFHRAFSLSSSFPAVARIVLKEKTLAKSHRPRQLFSSNTCPIIGGEGFGELLVSISRERIDRLRRVIGSGTHKEVCADLSTVERIEAYTGNDAAGPLGIDRLNDELGKGEITSLKLRLFEHKEAAADNQIEKALFELAQSLQLPAPERLEYISGLRLYRLKGIKPGKVSQIAEFVGTQSLGVFAQVGVFAQYIPRGKVTHAGFPKPEPEHTYPLVGIIDSGTDPNNKLLQSWVVDRDEEDVPRADQDNNHGSFVAGLIINGRMLNHGDPRFPSCQAKVVDVVALPRAGTPVDETDMLKTIRRVVQKYQQVKIWNLSISQINRVCTDSVFSDFGIELDAIQKQYGVTFVTCAGNYTVPPLRGWPPENLGECDRIFAPGDSALGVTVGSAAHLEHTNSRVRKEEPSPFSRRGPGAAFLPKPEVCHYGGNCDGTLDYQQIGVMSLDGDGNIAEAVGTSFSTPLVSSILANVRDGVVDSISQNLLKALLVQSAAMRAGKIEGEHLKYTGFGIPGEISEILTCAPWQATIIFETTIDPARRIFAREEFPIPACFRRKDGRVEGEFLMTLVYDPMLDQTAGAEYCQANIDVSLGTFDQDKDGKRKHACKIPLEPQEYDKMYERYLIEYGFKWSPVKVYRARLARTSGELWRIYMRMHHRAGVINPGPQNAALVVTLIDPKHEKPVYDDVVTIMNQTGWITQDLRVNERVRIRS